MQTNLPEGEDKILGQVERSKQKDNGDQHLGHLLPGRQVRVAVAAVLGARVVGTCSRRQQQHITDVGTTALVMDENDG